MTIKSDSLAVMRSDFVRQWAPLNQLHADFEINLDRLLYATFAVAQEPFIRELELFRDKSLKTAMLSPNAIVMKGDG